MKALKLITILIFQFLISLAVFAQSGLDDYLRIAAENNPGLKAKFSEYMAALEKVPQAGALPDPTVAFGYFLLPVETRLGPQQAKISLTQMFPWFGTTGAREDVATRMARAKYELFEESRSKLFYDVRSAWYSLYFTGKSIELTRENIDILNTLQKLALSKIEVGKASAVDELRVEMERLDLENQLKELLDRLGVQQTAFRNLLNAGTQLPLELPDTLLVDSLEYSREAVLDSIRLNNHQLLSLGFQEAGYSSQQDLARKLGKPAFSLGLDYLFIGKSSNPALAPGESGRDALMLPMVGVSIPLYRKKYTAMLSEAVYMQESVQNQTADRFNILENNFESAGADYADALRRMDLYTRKIGLAEKALRILESGYATDGRSFEELLRMEREVLKYRLELEKSRTDLNTSIAFIHYLMGK